jgi:hypothetical protein
MIALAPHLFEFFGFAEQNLKSFPYDTWVDFTSWMINVRKRVMAKGQKRSNREAKKPKQPKSEKKTAVPLTLLAPERGLTRAQKGRELPRR